MFGSNTLRVLISLVLISGCARGHGAREAVLIYDTAGAVQAGQYYINAVKAPPFQVYQQLLSEKTAVIVPNVSPDSSPDVFARGKAMGALKGAVLVTCEVLKGSLVLAVVIGTPIGAALGAEYATSPDKADRMEQSVRQALNRFTPTLDLGRRVTAGAKSIGASSVELLQLPTEFLSEEDIQEYEKSGFRTLVEVHIREINFSESRKEPPKLALHLQSQVRVTELPSGQVRYGQIFEYSSPARSFNDWLAGDGVQLRQGLSEGLDRLATNIVGGIFASTRVISARRTWTLLGTQCFGCCWICPKYPRLDYNVFDKMLYYPIVNSFRPTLAWEEVPSNEDAGKIEREVGQKPDWVYYDLRIWKMQGPEAGKLVYEKRSLPMPSHTVDEELTPDTQYFWSVRSCLQIKGVKTCTPWASWVPDYWQKCPPDHIPTESYFRFMTPPLQKRYHPRW